LFRAYNEVKANSKAHDKKISLITSRNYNSLQASKPWAASEDVATFTKGRDAAGGSRGRGQGFRGQGWSGNKGNPRQEQFNSGGKEYNRSGSSFRGKGQPNRQNQPNRGGQQNGSRNFNNGNSGNFNRPNNNNNGNNSGFQQKNRPGNKSFRGGGN
jgi:hypothetical protein